jgi:hypothetical protein
VHLDLCCARQYLSTSSTRKVGKCRILRLVSPTGLGLNGRRQLRRSAGKSLSRALILSSPIWGQHHAQG